MILKENDINAFIWHDKNEITYCSEADNCNWPNSLLFKRLNGKMNGNISAQNGNTDIFINNAIYEYMKEDNDWYDLILEPKWRYGEIEWATSSMLLNGENVYGVRNDGQTIYKVESGQLPAVHYEKIDDVMQYAKYEWSKWINAKIGLMYIHDYYLAYDNIRNFRDIADKSSWIYLDNNDNIQTLHREWIISNRGGATDNVYGAWNISKNGNIETGLLTNNACVRPTFYLKNNIKLSGGGTLDNPYIINF